MASVSTIRDNIVSEESISKTSDSRRASFDDQEQTRTADPKVESTVEANCADPTMEIPVERTRPVGHSSSSAVPDADAIEALPTVLTSKSHDAADTENFPTSGSFDMINSNDHLENFEQLSLQEQEHETSIWRGLISTTSLSPTSDSSRNKLHGPSCIRPRFLSLKEQEAVMEMQSTTGKFSYYILNNGRVIVHPEDEKAKQSQALLKSSFIKTTGNKFDVIVKESSFDGTFCIHRIGATMLAEGPPVTVGMYVSYDGVLFFITSAHNFILYTSAANPQSIDRHEIPHDGKHARFDVMGTKVPIAPLYYIFSNTTSLESRGQKIMHAADIAIGLAPIFTHLVTKGMPQFETGLQEGQDMCQDCGKALEECVARHHRRDPNHCQYKVSGFYDFAERECSSQERDGQTVHCVRFKDETLLDGGGALVRCRPSGKSVVAGRVISFDNRLIYKHPRQEPFDAYNVLLIRPENHLVEPMPGDSGSVWVIDGTNKALAITIGMGRGEDGRWLWAAAPLSPLLDGLCCAFPNVFTDPARIEPVQLPTGVSAGMHRYNDITVPSATATAPSGGPIAGTDSAYVTRYSQQKE